MHSPKILGNLCATCIGSRKGDSRGSRKIPRKTSGRLPSHTNAQINTLQYKNYDMHGMHSKISKFMHGMAIN